MPDAHDEGASASSAGSGGASWKEIAGRSTGGDGYKFGDVTRSLLSKAAVAGVALKSTLVEGGGGGGGGGGNGSGGADDDEGAEELMFRSFEDMMEQSGVSLEDFGAAGGGDDVSPTDDDPVMRELWLNFFNATYAVGKRATEVGLLTQDDFEECPPELFLGLPALAAFECALRSAGSGVEGFVLFNGSVLHSAELNAVGGEGGDGGGGGGGGGEGGGEGAGTSAFQQLMGAMMGLTQTLNDSDFSDESLFALRTKMIKASGGAMVAPTEEVRNEEEGPL